MNFTEYIKRYKQHEAYIKKAYTLNDKDKPEQFTDKIKWFDRYPTLINFLREIPGRIGVPLSYLCRPTNVQAKAAYEDFIDEYVDKASLVGQVFTTDAAEVRTYIFRFTSGNTVAEAKMIANAVESNGRIDFMALKDHYEGAGVNAVNVVQDDKVLNAFFIQVKRNHTCGGTSLRGS